MRYSATHKQETRDKLLRSSRAIAKKGGFGTTGVDALMAAVGLTGGAFYSHFGSKAELFAAIIEHELEQSTDMLAGDEASPPDHVAKRIRSYLSTYHATHPDEGCVLPTLGPEIARAAPEIRAAVERSLKRVQKSWSERLGDSDAGWGLIAQCVGAIVLARVVESERTRQEILASSRRFLQDKVQVPAAGGKAAQAKAPEPAGAAAAGAAPEHAATPLADSPVAATAGAGSPGPATPASEPVGDGAVRAQAPAAPPRPAGTQATTKLAQLEPSAAAGDGAAEVAAGAAPRAPRKRTTATRSRPPT